ncbi:hypothetical protein Slala02_03220 [Streptomyces lavendulae subsp. lavendulae]|nr:hypothetical protein Slala01_12810 [Streptomyces lavendulae subsp. lavendulae]GLX24502.1 hypothetical protein Slala02_03220 [Streptomyces lavendulae subsp. lavendulae]
MEGLIHQLFSPKRGRSGPDVRVDGGAHGTRGALRRAKAVRNWKRGGLMTVAVVAAVRSELRYIPVSFRASGRV